LKWWEDIHPDTRRKILRIGTGLVVLALTIVLWFNRHWLLPKPPPPDYSAYHRVEEPRELLFGTFQSYDSERSVGRQLHHAGRQWTADRTHIEGTYNYPPYKLDTLVVHDYPDRGITGKLTLEFYNDLLLRASFVPTDPNRYYLRVQADGIRFEKLAVSVWEYSAGNLRVRSNILYATSNMGQTLGTEPYVSWEDTRLVAQDRQWYANFGSKYAMTPTQVTEAGRAE
jgi:hypothetical protein